MQVTWIGMLGNETSQLQVLTNAEKASNCNWRIVLSPTNKQIRKMLRKKKKKKQIRRIDLIWESLKESNPEKTNFPQENPKLSEKDFLIMLIHYYCVQNSLVRLMQIWSPN